MRAVPVHERHRVDGQSLELVVHRKGATRAFGPGEQDVPALYRDIGQPVIIGGSMETGSALLVGTAHAMVETWGSTAHGAGRTMSRAQAKRRIWGETLVKEMEERDIIVRAASKAGVAEEAGFAYKDLGAVVDVLHRLDLSRKVVTLSPIGNIVQQRPSEDHYLTRARLPDWLEGRAAEALMLEDVSTSARDDSPATKQDRPARSTIGVP